MSPSYPNATLSFTPLFSSSSSSPSLHFTPFRLCPQHYVFPPAPPLTTHSNSTLAASASPPSLHYSYCWKLHRQILTVKYSFIQLDSLYSSPLFSCLPTQLELSGALFWVPKHPIYKVVVVLYLDSSIFWFQIQIKTTRVFAARWFSSSPHMHKHHGSDFALADCVLLMNAHYQFILLCFGKHKYLN